MVYSRLSVTDQEYKLVSGKKIDYETSHAILLCDGEYLMQLRNNIPTISAPGQWSLFGGMIQDNESPLHAVRREVKEELELEPGKYEYFCKLEYYDPFNDSTVRTWFYSADVTKIWHRHKLNEGENVKAFEFDKLHILTIPSIMRHTIEKYHNERGVAGCREK